jgi:hypothetical protein
MIVFCEPAAAYIPARGTVTVTVLAFIAEIQ